MSITSGTRLLAAAGAAIALGLASPAFAQVDETKADAVPSCGANQTDDHCITRGHHMGHHMGGHHMGGHHHGHGGHHHGHHHHHGK